MGTHSKNYRSSAKGVADAAQKNNGRKSITVIGLEREECAEISLDEYSGLIANTALLNVIKRIVKAAKPESSINRNSLMTVLGISGEEA